MKLHLSPPIRIGLLVLLGGWGERKRERARNDGKGEVRRQAMCGSLAGFAVLCFWLNQPTIWMLLNAVVKIIF